MRFACPPTTSSQVGLCESSKSASHTFAPEFSALIVIFRSVGPVISTRRSRRSAGASATFQSPGAHVGGLGQEVQRAGARDLLAALAAALEQLHARVLCRPVQLGEEGQRVVGEHLLLAIGRVSRDDLDTRRRHVPVLLSAMARSAPAPTVRPRSSYFYTAELVFRIAECLHWVPRRRERRRG